MQIFLSFFRTYQSFGVAYFYTVILKKMLAIHHKEGFLLLPDVHIQDVGKDPVPAVAEELGAPGVPRFPGIGIRNEVPKP